MISHVSTLSLHSALTRAELLQDRREDRFVGLKITNFCLDLNHQTGGFRRH